MTSTILTILDLVSQVFATILLVGGVLGFAFRKWIAASIDSHFTRKIALELEKVKHDFSRDIEHEKAQLIKDLEAYKRQLDGGVRIASRVSDKKVEAYETYSFEFGRVLTDLQALRHLYVATPPIAPEHLERLRLKALDSLQAAKDKLNTCNFYLDPDITVRIATFYRDLVQFIASGARDESRLEQLTMEEAYIGADLQTSLQRASGFSNPA
ncbi:MAG: hypothetical protein ACLQFT_03980 [Steroidobacteraceae bacterium]|jgi:hypothetical protein